MDKDAKEYRLESETEIEQLSKQTNLFKSKCNS